MGHFGSKKIPPGAQHDSEAYGAAGEDVQHYPVLVEFLTRCRYDDGSPRLLGRITLFVEGQRLKVCFNDKDGDMVAFRVIDSLDGLVAALEKGLEDPDIDWRPGKDQSPYRGRR